MKSLPKQVGDATIDYLDEDKWPSRENEKIKIPHDPDMDWIWLHKNQQFLLNFPYGNNKRCYFGGMDESPFLVELNMSAYESLIKGGEKAFYMALKPIAIRRAEKVLKIPAKRQGDIFSIEIPFTKTQLQCIDQLFDMNVPQKFIKNKKINIFGTRHTIEANLLSTENETVSSVLAKDALLKAPDHVNLELPGMQFLEQADLLKKPKEAD